MKMQLIHHKQSKHILAACTLIGEASADLEHLVGEGLPLRDPSTGKLLLSLEPKYLQHVEVDLETRVLLQPGAFQLNDQDLPDAVPAFGTLTISLNGATITITVTPIPTERKLWVHVAGLLLTETPMLELTLAANTSNCIEPLVLPKGTYQVLVLLPEWQSTIKEVIYS